MRIFSIHKSKSKKQVSEKTPKLAANKFLEKRKVGTVIYLHEHPSGKIHGPYRKDNDKKIMKGGWRDLERNDFKISENPQLLEGTNQLIIKEEKKTFLIRLIINDPYIFFGDNTFTIDGIPSYTYVINNTHYRDKSNRNKNKFVQEFLVCRKLEPEGHHYRPKLVKINEIEPKILLGLYYQYILRCKQDYPSLKLNRDVQNYYRLYMKRLFLYLLLYVLPILNKYIAKIIDNDENEYIKEKKYYSEIFEYLADINFDEFLDMFAMFFNMPQNFKQEFKQGYEKEEQKIKNRNTVENSNAVERISENVRRNSIIIESMLESQPSSSGTGPININPAMVIPLLPIIVVGVAIGGVICGSFYLGKQLIKKINEPKEPKKHKNGNRNRNKVEIEMETRSGN
jgi:hypothetical protein